MSPMQAFATALAPLVGATLGQDLFISKAPSSDHGPAALWWLRAGGGAPVTHAVSGERVKNYEFQVYYRDPSAQVVYDKLFNLEALINSSGLALDGYNVVDVNAYSFPSDQDLDDEDREVGLLQIAISIYKE